MARKTSTGTEFSFDSLAVQDVAELPKGTRDTTPNPLEQHVKDAIDGGPKALGPLPNGAKAEEAARLIRRAVTVNDLSYRLRYTDAEDKPLTPKQLAEHEGEIWVYFSISSEKVAREYKPRAYSAADIREFLQLEAGDKITQDHRNAYREAHNLPIRER